MKNLKDLLNSKNIKTLLVIGLIKKAVVVAMLFLPQWLSAQSDLEKRIISQFEVLPITSKDIVFLGNSITERGLWSEIFNDVHCKNRGIGGQQTQDILERLHQVTDGKPKKIFLLIGINDLNGDPARTAKAVANIRTIIERIQTESPKTKLYVQSILPVGKSREEKNREVKKANPEIKKICDEKGVTYIDIHSAFADEEGYLKQEYTINDGLHLNGAGYMAWAEILRPYVKK